MTRFDADSPDDRASLFVAAIRAHRERSSPYLTVEVDAGDDSDPGGTDPLSADPDPEALAEDLGAGDGGTGSGDETATEPAPWIQFSDGTVNLDCTDAELDRLKALLDEYPAFRIDDLTSPGDAEGTNVRITARADANRIADFLDRALRTVYELPADYRAWVTEV